MSAGSLFFRLPWFIFMFCFSVLLFCFFFAFFLLFFARAWRKREEDFVRVYVLNHNLSSSKADCGRAEPTPQVG